ncbi:flagellar hook-associated protein FlgK [Candidatus Liberibacter sp.]|uniref:flagellar hook-associated protein FlgK n=1 Tax=Candidatus Liberibacter sp. TaxID=34022 RepID=UPI0015F61B7E|nr:flagellar hook-associated protein FlgK [Candidatus Liberibacter sp.]MBA5723548.1 flagellar hook-associated protein FlgK [Candidatus Liberibacter sp.]
MSFSTAFHKAQNIFSNASAQLTTLIQNIENAENKNYVRQDAVTTSLSDELVVVTKKRVQNQDIFQKILEITSSATGQQRFLEGLESLRTVVSADNDFQRSPSSYIAKLQESLQIYANNSSKTFFGNSVIEAAKEAANNLNASSQGVQKLRTNVDKEVDIELSQLRQFLSEFAVINNEVKLKTSTKGDVYTLLDRRDSLLNKISEIIGITTITRHNDDMVIYTTDGITLFETSPREITFEKTALYSATVESKSVFIDGVMVSIPDDLNTAPKGKIGALLQIRDGIVPVFHNQLDEMARGLIIAFAEKDPVSGRSPDVPGLFVADDLTLPDNKLQKGISELIRVNHKYQSNPNLLRDGGSFADKYKWNSNGFAGYSDLINHYQKSLNESFTFDSMAGIDTPVNLLQYGRNSIGWLEQYRSHSHNSHIKNQAVFKHISESYSNATGVNLQEELGFLIQAEQSCKVSNKLIIAIDEMLKTLLEKVR